MPLNKSSSASAFSENVAAERTAKKPLKQALAIAYRVQRDARKRRAEGGRVRGPQGFGEHLSDALHDRGLPASLDPDDLRANPVGVAAVGRAIAGGQTDPNVRVRQGFKAIEERTVPDGYAPGGSIPTPFFARQGASMLGHTGMVHSATGGRSDKVPMGVKPGAFVLPADVVSGVGHGNSMAGAAAFNQLFKQGPYGAAPGAARPVGRVPMTAKSIRQKFANGGAPVPIVASGGEYIVDPDSVAEIGGGDLDKGHDILDQMVKHIRSKTIKTLRKLPPPKKK